MLQTIICEIIQGIEIAKLTSLKELHIGENNQGNAVVPVNRIEIKPDTNRKAKKRPVFL